MSVSSGPPLGIIPAEYASTSLSLERGDRLFLLTDGVFDAKNREGRRIGFEDIVRFVRAHMHEDRLVDAVVDYVDDFSGGGERADDLTIVELRWGG
jgi:sigma-B regulation protein RsbU (phosphoserine phosphatase)